MEGNLAWVFNMLSLWPCQTLSTPWTVALQTPLSMGFSRQEYWSELPCPPPGDLPKPGIEPTSPALAGGFFTTSATWEAQQWMEVPPKSFLCQVCMSRTDLGL